MRTGGGTADAAVGMMDGAYFVSKTEILNFLNALLKTNLTKIEQTATGAVACQLTEYIFPGSIPMSRVNWEARSAHEFVSNYKLLQAAFTKHGIRRHVDVDRLIRAKYQDNLEFCQWIKAFYEQCPPPAREAYDPIAVRARGKGGKHLPIQFQPKKRAGGSSSSGRRPPTGVSSSTPSRRGSSSSSAASSGAAATPKGRPPVSVLGSGSGSAKPPPAAKRASSGSALGGGGLPPAGRGLTAPHAKENVGPSASSANSNPNTTDNKADAAAAAAAAADFAKKNANLTARNAELQLKLEKSELERTFYFEKLRGIEALVQAREDNSARVSDPSAEVLVNRIARVLGATTDDDQLVGEGGEFLGDETRPPNVGTAAAASAKDLLKDDLFADGDNDMDLSLIEA